MPVLLPCWVCQRAFGEMTRGVKLAPWKLNMCINTFEETWGKGCRSLQLMYETPLTVRSEVRVVWFSRNRSPQVENKPGRSSPLVSPWTSGNLPCEKPESLESSKIRRLLSRASELSEADRTSMGSAFSAASIFETYRPRESEQLAGKLHVLWDDATGHHILHPLSQELVADLQTPHSVDCLHCGDNRPQLRAIAGQVDSR